MRPGALCAMTYGKVLMLVWPVDNWDSHHRVSVPQASYMYNFLTSLYFTVLLTDAVAYLSPTSTTYSQGTGPIFLDNVNCDGTESRLADCTYDSHTADCTHSEDAGIHCQRKCIIMCSYMHSGIILNKVATYCSLEYLGSC